MSRWLLDTNVVSELRRPGCDAPKLMQEIPVVFSDERHVEVQWRTLDGWRVEDLGRLARPFSHGWSTASKPLARWSNASVAPLEFARA